MTFLVPIVNAGPMRSISTCLLTYITIHSITIASIELNACFILLCVRERAIAVRLSKVAYFMYELHAAYTHTWLKVIGRQGIKTCDWDVAQPQCLIILVHVKISRQEHFRIRSNYLNDFHIWNLI
jgi:hypothetical protein